MKDKQSKNATTRQRILKNQKKLLNIWRVMQKELEVPNEVNEINYDQNKILEALLEGGYIIRALIIN